MTLAVVSVGAQRRVPHSPSAVYALLSDLSRHWPLLGRDLVDAEIRERSAELILRGPVPGVRRHVATQVTYAEPDSAFGGEAVAGATRASIGWRLRAEAETETLVAIDVGIDPGGRSDRLLLAAARPWLIRRCGRVLARLERELSIEAAA